LRIAAGLQAIAPAGLAKIASADGERRRIVVAWQSVV
jgi:hypothetical protein